MDIIDTCASDMVAEQMSSPNQVAPTALIPFKVEREASTRAFREWVASLWLRPSSLKKLAKVNAVDGIYVPFWTFDAATDTVWQAERGDYYYEEQSYTNSEGKKDTRQVRRTRWTPCRGEHRGAYDDVLICGSRGLKEELLSRVEPFDTIQGLIPFDTKFLTGWIAEEYAVGPREAWIKGKEEIQERERLACIEQVPGDTQRGLNLSTKIDEVTWKHVLLPVWVAAYQYNGKSYRFLVNGETGKVSGEAPLSWTKIAGLLALYFFLVALFVFLFTDQGVIEKLMMSILVSVGGLFTVGTPIALSHLMKSRNANHRRLFELYQRFRS